MFTRVHSVLIQKINVEFLFIHNNLVLSQYHLPVFALHSFSRQRNVKTKQNQSAPKILTLLQFTTMFGLSVSVPLFPHSLFGKLWEKTFLRFFLSLLVWIYTLFLFFIVRLWTNILCLCWFPYFSPQYDYFSVCCNSFCPDFSYLLYLFPFLPCFSILFISFFLYLFLLLVEQVLKIQGRRLL